ncbi:MAG: RNA polymerase sigma factor [Gemmatimonadales bacterium]|nr:RNA polymerase sigma factor [Gemmatimonadales bacterium]
MRPSDHELVERIAEGEDDALALLMRRHAAPLMRFAASYLRSADDADEVLQDVFLRARGAFRRGARPNELAGWLFRVTVNRCRTRQRRWWPFVGGTRAESALAGASAPPTAGDLEWREEIDKALTELSPVLREAFLLRHVEGMDYEEMARVTGSRIPALKMRVARARLQLRLRLEDLR